MATSKTKAPPAERTQPTETPTPGLFMHAARAPEVSPHPYHDQRRFGGYWAVGENYGATNGPGARIAVYRNAFHLKAELDVSISTDWRKVTRTTILMTADEMQALACALLDAAHDLRTRPVPTARKAAQAVPA